MITPRLYLHFRHNIEHYYQTFLQNNIFSGLQPCQWKMVPRKNGNEYLKKAIKRGKTIDTFNYACEILPSFLLHLFIKQKQSKT